MEKQKKVEDQALQDMVEMAQVLSKSEKTEQTLYNYIKKLYTLYKSEGLFSCLFMILLYSYSKVDHCQVTNTQEKFWKNTPLRLNKELMLELLTKQFKIAFLVQKNFSHYNKSW